MKTMIDNDVCVVYEMVEEVVNAVWRSGRQTLQASTCVVVDVVDVDYDEHTYRILLSAEDNRLQQMTSVVDYSVMYSS